MLLFVSCLPGLGALFDAEHPELPTASHVRSLEIAHSNVAEVQEVAANQQNSWIKKFLERK